MRKSLHAAFLLMGFGFTAAQALLIRELLVAFFGNELSIGLILANWLILEAVGSGLLAQRAGRWASSPVSYAALQALLALCLPLCLYAAYASRSLVGAIPGEGVGLASIFWSSLLILAPVALIDGAMFTFGSRAYAQLTGQEAPAAGWVYVLEGAGAIAGGIVFTTLLIPFLEPVQIVLLLAGLNLLSAAWILAASAAPRARRTLGLGLVLILLATDLGLLLSPAAAALQRRAERRQWTGQNLVYSENSVYGNVAVVQQESQVTFYADGLPILTAPVPDVAQVEEIVHLPLLFVPEPQRALVLSGGLGGVLAELAKYPLTQIDYAELDPLLIDAVQAFPTPLTLSELADPRLHVAKMDGRLLVRRKAEQRPPGPGYDLILVHLPYPSTLQLNRFYTVEFFRMAAGLLSEQGVLAIGMPGSLSYMSAELRDLNLLAYHTLRQALPYVRPIPGDATLWLASASEALATPPLEPLPIDHLIQRWEERGLDARLITPTHIRLRLDQNYAAWFWDALEQAAALGQEPALGPPSPPAPAKSDYVNTDLHPLGLFYGLAYWNALFSPGLGRLFGLAAGLKLWPLALLILAGGLLLLGITRAAPRRRRLIVPAAIAATGFAGMAADLVIILAFQTLYGYVYHWIGLLIAAFMAGLSLGGLLMTRRLGQIRHGRATLLQIEGAIVLFSALLPLLLAGAQALMGHALASAAIQPLLFALNALAGLLVGCQFPLANQLWLAGQGPSASPAGSGGLLYASDLVGAFLGAVLVSVLLIPVLGITAACLLVALLKLGSLALVLFSGRLSPDWPGLAG